jgi:hypothetical protein
VAEAVTERELERGLPPDGMRLVLQVEKSGALFALSSSRLRIPRL